MENTNAETHSIANSLSVKMEWFFDRLKTSVFGINVCFFAERLVTDAKTMKLRVVLLEDVLRCIPPRILTGSKLLRRLR